VYPDNIQGAKGPRGRVFCLEIIKRMRTEDLVGFQENDCKGYLVLDLVVGVAR